MPQLIVSVLAQSDTAYIATDLARKAGYRVAEKYIAAFETIYGRLTVYPDSGPRRPAVGLNIRIGVVRPYVVLYEHDQLNDIVTIFRIVHGKRKITGKLLRGD